MGEGSYPGAAVPSVLPAVPVEGGDQARCPSCLTRRSLLRCLVSDINELKVFVDLASISAGENDMDVDRVACFHGSVHGYSSLLYELRHDSGFEDFMRCLQKLWRALDSDETLPEKLVSAAGAAASSCLSAFQEWLEVGLHWPNGTCVGTSLLCLLLEDKQLMFLWHKNPLQQL